MKPPATFSKLRTRENRLKSRVWWAYTAAEHVSDRLTQAAFRKRNKKAKMPPRYKLNFEFQEIRNAVSVRVQEIVKKLTDDIKRLEKAKKYRAGKEKVVLAAEPRKVFSVSRSNYSSMGFGDMSYARNAASQVADHLALHGVTSEVVIEDSCAVVYANLDFENFDKVILKPTYSLVEQVRRMWKRGINPRVDMPFLPHGFEEKNGLDFFGGYLAADSGKQTMP